MTQPLRIDDIFRFEIPGDPDLSPDGSRVAYVLTGQDEEQDAAASAIYLVDATGGAPRKLTNGPADAAPRWSPDGTALAFLRAGQLHLIRVDGGEARQLTTEESRAPGAGPAAWSPDGTRIAFSALDAPRSPDAPVVVEELHWKVDGAGVVGTARTQIFVVDVASGLIEQLTEGTDNCAAPVWSPDGTRLAFIGESGPGLEHLRTSAPYVIDVRADVEPGRPPAPPRRCGTGIALTGPLSWYPDGSALLVTGRTTVSVGHLNLLRQPLDGGAPALLAADQDRNVMPGGPGYPGALAQFHGEDILFAVRDRGSSRLCVLSADSDRARYLDLPQRLSVNGAKVSQAAGTVAFVYSDESTFGEVGVVDLDSGKFRRLTRHMETALPDVRLPICQDRAFTVSDGAVVPGWVIRDPAAPAGGPLLVDVHGGPHNAWSPQADAVHLYHHELVSQGWTILVLNIRGSDGYGEAHYQAVVGGWGEADERDVLEPVATLVQEGLVDPARIALTGYSYGGFMACWLSARSEVFAAVVPGGVVTDLRSMAGTSDEGQVITELEIGGAEMLERLSPLTYVDAVRAPTLILHGAADDRCPPGQAEEWFQALRIRGVQAQLVLYPGASHLFILNGRPSHRVDYCRRVADWVITRTAS
ncbi:S9 family peptidase [Catenulispora sp. NL8]|uniref:S9 family peptidase n=1 Tax=Catenulispora pinistramenti TaxID=2705254 RepID=A0ABS5KQT5_9ACTN|nr:S9 family peptidase [Catenulispora pinistramenti]MBS2548411.1 S9 family peptidase [Catenulispora pinistramenti]